MHSSRNLKNSSQRSTFLWHAPDGSRRTSSFLHPSTTSLLSIHISTSPSYFPLPSSHLITRITSKGPASSALPESCGSPCTSSVSITPHAGMTPATQPLPSYFHSRTHRWHSTVSLSSACALLSSSALPSTPTLLPSPVSFLPLPVSLPVVSRLPLCPAQIDKEE